MRSEKEKNSSDHFSHIRLVDEHLPGKCKT
jgi:hypothetical protein